MWTSSFSTSCRKIIYFELGKKSSRRHSDIWIFIQGRDLTNFSKYFQYFWTSLFAGESGDCVWHNRAQGSSSRRQELSQSFRGRTTPPPRLPSVLLHSMVAVLLEASRLQRPLLTHPHDRKLYYCYYYQAASRTTATSRSKTSLHFCPTVSRLSRTESCFEASVVVCYSCIWSPWQVRFPMDNFSYIPF